MLKSAQCVCPINSAVRYLKEIMAMDFIYKAVLNLVISITVVGVFRHISFPAAGHCSHFPNGFHDR